MDSPRKNKQLHIDKEALNALTLLQEGLLYPIDTLMSQKQALEVEQTGMYKNQSCPYPFLLTPGGKRNEAVLEGARRDEKLELVCEGQVVGGITTGEIFEINAKQKTLHRAIEEKEEGGKIGKYALDGALWLKDSPLKPYKDLVLEKKQKLQAKNITGIVFGANPLHRVHEKILRDEFCDADLIVVFLLRFHQGDFLDFELRKQCLELVLKNFLASEKICIIPLDATYLFFGRDKIVFYSLIAKNYGCTKIVLGQKTLGLSVFHNQQTKHTALQSLQKIGIEAKILDEYAYCTKCRCLLNTTSCPHGKHHHIAYKSHAILQFFKMGIMPPTILMRKEVSALVLKALYPSRTENMKSIYYNILPSDGIFSEDIQEDFYTKLIELYRIRN